MICHYGQGIPRTINILCDNAFLMGYDRGKKKINALIIQAPDGTYKLHVATFLIPELVEKYKNEPLLQGKKIEVIPRNFSNKQAWYRILVGNFASREESLAAIQALKEKRLLPHFR